MFRSKRLLRLVILLTVIYIIQLGLKQQITINNTYHQCRADQKTHCMTLYQRLKTIDNKRTYSTPIKSIPNELFAEFTQNGGMPLKRYAFINETLGVLPPERMQHVITSHEIEQWRAKIRKDESLGYNSFLFENVLRDYSDKIDNRKFVVFGTQSPWVEALALELGAVNVTTVDYFSKVYEQDDLKWFQMKELLDKSIDENIFEHFSNAASYSFLEHIGLGRYGEALAPNGDIDTLQQIQCLLKPDGLMFLGVQTSPGLNESYIEFNYHRVYGKNRLELLIGNGWEILSSQRESHNLHTLFVLQKKVC